MVQFSRATRATSTLSCREREADVRPRLPGEPPADRWGGGSAGKRAVSGIRFTSFSAEKGRRSTSPGLQFTPPRRFSGGRAASPRARGARNLRSVLGRRNGRQGTAVNLPTIARQRSGRPVTLNDSPSILHLNCNQLARRADVLVASKRMRTTARARNDTPAFFDPERMIVATSGSGPLQGSLAVSIGHRGNAEFLADGRARRSGPES